MKKNIGESEFFPIAYNHYGKEFELVGIKHKYECLECAKEVNLQRFKQFIENLLYKEKKEVKVSWNFYSKNYKLQYPMELILLRFGIFSYQAEGNFEVIYRSKIVNPDRCYFTKSEDAVKYVDVMGYCKGKWKIHKIGKVIIGEKHEKKVEPDIEYRIWIPTVELNL